MRLVLQSASRGRFAESPLARSLGRLPSGTIDSVRAASDNTRGLPSLYNAVLERYAGQDVLALFVHDDVTLADVFLRDKLEASPYGITGLAGARAFALHTDHPTSWSNAPRHAWSGAVEHGAGRQSWWSGYGPTPQRCAVLDGLFLAVHCGRIGAVRFDPRFAFDCYDYDLCLSAYQAGVTMGTTNVYVHHASLGDVSGRVGYEAAQAALRAKWTPHLNGPIQVEED